MRAFIVASALVSFFAMSAAIGQAHYSTTETDIGTLMDDPAARAIINKYVPGFSSKDQIGLAMFAAWNFTYCNQLSVDSPAARVYHAMYAPFGIALPAACYVTTTVHACLLRL